jgi:light-regulated signal transduction histidine kinase (bacteriophytochrome)
VALDVTERKKAEDELQKLHADLERRVAERTAELEAVNKELESFCYSVSHDLQTPLRAIDGYSRMIMKRAGERFDEETRGRFAVIRESIQKMGQLITDLLAFSRLGRTQLSIVRWTRLIKAWEGRRPPIPTAMSGAEACLGNGGRRILKSSPTSSQRGQPGSRTVSWKHAGM